MNAREIVANNIKYYRLKNNWSQEDLAEKLDTTPVFRECQKEYKNRLYQSYC